MIFYPLTKLIGITVFYILFTQISAKKKSHPEVINWREPLVDLVSSIQTPFIDVINDNAPIRYSAGSESRRLKDHTIEAIKLDGNKPIVWQLCDAVDINMMGMEALASPDKHLNEKANKNGFAKVCRLVDLDQLDALPAGSVYLLISDNRENIIASYICNSDEMEANQHKYEEYQKSYGLTLGAIVS
jgi:hypothetical protein